MGSILTILRTLEGASGFFVPILLLGLFLRPRQCWKNSRAALIFALVSGGLLLFYLILGKTNPVSRYFFVPVLLCCFFCGGGFAGILSKIKQTFRPVILWSICFLICFGSALQIVLRTRKEHIARIAQKIAVQHSAGKSIVLCTNHGDAPKIAAFLKRKLLPCELIELGEFDKKFFLVDLPSLDLNQKELYLLTGVPKQQSAGEWRQELQSCCYLTPFDLAADEIYRKRRLLLWRFNGKVGGKSLMNIAALPETFPERIHLNTGKKFHHIPVCDAGQLKAGKGHLFNYSDSFSKVEENFWQYNFPGQIMEQLSFSCCNEFYWPTAVVIYRKERADTLKKTQISLFDKGILPAADPMLTYPCFRLIYPENFVPSWSDLAVNQYSGKEYRISGKEKNGVFSGTLAHAESGKEIAVEFPVIRQSLEALKNSNLKVLWIANRYNKELDLTAELKPLIGSCTIQRCVEEVLITSYKIPAKDILKIAFPAFSPDVVLLDIFAYALFDRDLFEFRSELFYERLESILQQCQKRFPHTQIMLLLPPIPGRRELQLPRYRLAFLLQNFLKVHPEYNLWIIDPAGGTDRNLDFSRNIASGCYNPFVQMLKSGKEKTARIVAAHLAYFLSGKNKK